MREAVPTAYSRPNQRPARPKRISITADPKSCWFFMRSMTRLVGTLHFAQGDNSCKGVFDPILWSPCSLGLDAGEFVVIAPSLDVLGEQLCEHFGVARERITAEIVQPLLRVRRGHDLVEPSLQFADDGLRRLRRHEHGPPGRQI